MTYIPNRAPLASPTFTGDPVAPTPATADNDTSIATTAYVQANLGSYLTTTNAANTYAPKVSPTFTGTVTVPAPLGTSNTTEAASTAFVRSAITTYGAAVPVVTTVKTTAYTAAVGEIVLCDPTTAGFTVTIPATHASGNMIRVKNASASANSITIDPADADTIDGAATFVLNDARGSITIVSDGTNWHIV